MFLFFRVEVILEDVLRVFVSQVLNLSIQLSLLPSEHFRSLHSSLLLLPDRVHFAAALAVNIVTVAPLA